ncbi:MAG: extracellular solute-binding protein [Clostridiales bacterium]|nr:extracellular solute-binding protein [Clostridiales bacterium]
MKKIKGLTSVCLVLALLITMFVGAGALADDEIVLRVVDWSDSSVTQRAAFHEAFEKNHPGVKIEYTCMTIDQFSSSVVSLISSGDAPDLFPVPIATGMTLQQAYDDGWFQSLDDYLTDDFKATLEDNCFQEGITQIDGSLYTIPEKGADANTLFYYNKDVLDKAGVTELPKTYDDFIAVCKQVTDAGKGEYYGLIEGGNQANRLSALLLTLAAYNGSKVAENAKVVTDNGVCTFDNQQMLDAFAMLKKVFDDGSLHPDTINISAPEARELFAQGKAAFLCQGMWCISTWANTYPDLNYGVMAPPKASADSVGAIQAPATQPWMGIYSGSKHPELAAEYLMGLYADTDDYHFQADCIKIGERTSVVKGLTEKYMNSAIMSDYYTIAKEASAIVPSITVRDNDYYKFYSEVVGITPSLASILQGVWSSSITDYETPLHTLAAASTAEWKRACEAAGVSYDGLEFPNWVVGTSYTAADYAALPALN